MLNKFFLSLLLLSGIYYLFEVASPSAGEWALWGLRCTIIAILFGFYVIWMISLLKHKSEFSRYIIHRSWIHFIITFLGVMPVLVQMLFLPMNWVNTRAELILLATIDLPIAFTSLWLLLFYLFIREGADVVFYSLIRRRNIVKNKKLLYKIMAINGAIMIGAPVGLWGLMVFTLIF